MVISIKMLGAVNKDMVMLAVILTVAAACAFLYKESQKMKDEISSCKSFSINLANRIPAPSPKSVPAPAPVSVRETEEEVAEE